MAVNLSSSLPFPLRARKLSSLSGLGLTTYTHIANLEPLPSIHIHRRDLLSFRRFLLTISTRPEFTPTEPGGTPPLILSLNALLKRYDVQSTGALTAPLFSHTLLSLFPELDPPTIAHVFAAFSAGGHGTEGVDIEMFVNILQYWLTETGVEESSTQALSSLAIGQCRPRDSMCELIVPDSSPPPPASPPRHSGNHGSNPIGVRRGRGIDTPSSIVTMLAFLTTRLPLYQILCTRISPHTSLITLSDLRFILDQCSVKLSDDGWRLFKDWALNENLRDARDSNLIDYRKVVAMGDLPATSPPTPPPVTPVKKLPPHSLLLQVGDRWDDIVANVCNNVDGVPGPDCVVTFETFKSAVLDAGLIFSHSDAQGVYDSVAGERATLGDFMKAFALKGDARSTVEVPSPETNLLMSAQIGKDLYSQNLNTHQKKHFTRGVFGHTDSKRIGMYMPEGREGTNVYDGDYKVSPPFAGDAADDEGAAIVRDYVARKGPWADLGDLEEDLMSRQEQLSMAPMVLKRAAAAATLMREEQKDSDVDPVFTIMPEFMYRRNKEMTRSEVYGVLQKLRVHVGGGDIEQIFYYFDVNNLRIDRETFYAILGGTVEAKYRTVPTKMRVGNESQEHPENSQFDGELRMPSKTREARGQTASTTAYELYGEKATEDIDSARGRRGSVVNGVVRTAASTAADLGWDRASPSGRGRNVDHRTAVTEAAELGWDKEDVHGRCILQRTVSSESKDLGLDKEEERGRKHLERKVSTENADHDIHQFYETEGLPLQQLRTMQAAKQKANMIVRTCVAQDPDGNGWVQKSVFLAAIEAAGVPLEDVDVHNVLEAMKGGLNKQGDNSEVARINVRYSGMVHRFETFLQRNTGSAVLPPNPRSPMRDRNESSHAMGGAAPQVNPRSPMRDRNESSHAVGVAAPSQPRAEPAWRNRNASSGAIAPVAREASPHDGTDPFEYLRITPPEEEARRERSSNNDRETCSLGWNPPDSPARKPLNLARMEPGVEEIASQIHMSRIDVAMCFRVFDVDVKGALSLKQLTGMLGSSKLKAVKLDGVGHVASQVASAIFKEAGKKEAGGRVDFNEVMLAVGGILAAAGDAEGRRFGEREGERRVPQSFGEHMIGVVNPPQPPQRRVAPYSRGEKVGFKRSQIMEDGLANSVMNSRSLTWGDGKDFTSAAVKIKHAFLAHNRRYSVENFGDSELSVRTGDVGNILYELGIIVNKKQLEYLLACAMGRGGGGINAEGRGGDYLSCRSLVAYLSELCGCQL